MTSILTYIPYSLGYKLLGQVISTQLGFLSKASLSEMQGFSFSLGGFFLCPPQTASCCQKLGSRVPSSCSAMLSPGSGAGPRTRHFKQCPESHCTSFFKENSTDDLNLDKASVRIWHLYKIRLDILLFATLAKVEIRISLNFFNCLAQATLA